MLGNVFNYDSLMFSGMVMFDDNGDEHDDKEDESYEEYDEEKDEVRL